MKLRILTEEAEELPKSPQILLMWLEDLLKDVPNISINHPPLLFGGSSLSIKGKTDHSVDIERKLGEPIDSPRIFKISLWDRATEFPGLQKVEDFELDFNDLDSLEVAGKKIIHHMGQNYGY